MVPARTRRLPVAIGRAGVDRLFCPELHACARRCYGTTWDGARCHGCPWPRAERGRRSAMATWTPDPTFYPSPKMAMDAPREELAYVAILNPEANKRPDALAVLDVNPASSSYASIVGRLDLPNVGDELHHFGWNACSAALCPNMPHPDVERRYLLIPGLRSSRMYIVDTQPDPLNPKIVKTIEADELQSKSGYSRPHTIHCG